MAGPLNVKIVMFRCSKTQKCFGVRVEQRGKDWVRTWARPLDEAVAKREKLDENTISGSMTAVDGFPGCPHCGDGGFVQCGTCGKVGCYGGVKENQYTCPWCKNKSGVTAAENFKLSGGGQ